MASTHAHKQPSIGFQNQLLQGLYKRLSIELQIIMFMKSKDTTGVSTTLCLPGWREISFGMLRRD